MSAPETTYKHRLLALVSLAAVSTSIGIMMKLSLNAGGRFEYSPFAANCMTEVYKLAVSVAIIAHLCVAAGKASGRSLMAEARLFFEANLSRALCLHVLGLTCLYVVVNLSVFGVMAHSTASNFFLMKASSPVLTAVILVGVFGRSVHRAQWVSIFAQCVGLVSTQLDLCRGEAAVQWIGYVFIALNIAVSCVAGVWNEHIIKTMAPSVNAQNAVMYLLGAVVNFMLFFLPAANSLLGSATGGEAPPTFFHGFNRKVVGVVVANGSVGLVITAVYKYADVVVKTFGIAGSVVSLYLLEAANVLPSSSGRSAQGPIALLGASIVFLASYVYILPPPAAADAASAAAAGAGAGNATNGGAAAAAATAHGNSPTAATAPFAAAVAAAASASDDGADLFDVEDAASKLAAAAARAQQAQAASAAAPGILSWSRLEITLLMLCGLLATVLTMTKCSG